MVSDSSAKLDQKPNSKLRSKQTNTPAALLTASRLEIDSLELNIEGKLPWDIFGYLYIVGPVGSFDSKIIPGASDMVIPSYFNGISIFNGDGMIYQIDFSQNKKVIAKTCLAKTPCFYADEVVSQSTTLRDEFKFQSVGFMRFSPRLGIRTYGNTAFTSVRFQNNKYPRLLLTSDNGRPYEIDPKTLKIISPVGRNEEWKSIKMPFSKGPFQMVGSAAHPAVDFESNELFTVNWSKSMSSMLAPVNLSVKDVEELLNHLPSFLNKRLWKLKVLNFVDKFSTLRDFIPLLQDIFMDQNEIACFFQKHLSEEMIDLLKKVEQALTLRPLKEISLLINFLIDNLELATETFSGVSEMEDFVKLIRWRGNQDIESWKILIENEGKLEDLQLLNSLHQIGVTRDYLVLVDTTFKVGINQVFGRNFPGWEYLLKLLRDTVSHSQSENSNVYVIRRSDLEEARERKQDFVVAKRVEIPGEIAHFAVDFLDSDDLITLHTAHNCAWDPAEWVQPYDENCDGSYNLPQGLPVASMDVNKLGKYVIDAKKAEIYFSQVISDAELTWSTAMYTHNPLLRNGRIDSIYWNSWGNWDNLKTKFSTSLYQKYTRREVSLNEVLGCNKPSNILRLDTKSMKIEDFYKFPSGYFANSSQFLPAKNGNTADSGYIVSVVIHDTPQSGNGTELWIFDASALSKGPICKIHHHALKFGMTIHSDWVPVAESQESDCRISIKEDYEELISEESPEIKEIFRKHVFPNF